MAEDEIRIRMYLEQLRLSAQPRYVREIRRMPVIPDDGETAVERVTYSDGSVVHRVRGKNGFANFEPIELGGIEVTNVDSPKREFVQLHEKRNAFVNAFGNEEGRRRYENEKLRRMLEADARADLQQPTISKPAPRRPIRTAFIYAWTFIRVLYRELYGPAHLRRYL